MLSIRISSSSSVVSSNGLSTEIVPITSLPIEIGTQIKLKSCFVTFHLSKRFKNRGSWETFGTIIGLPEKLVDADID